MQIGDYVIVKSSTGTYAGYLLGKASNSSEVILQGARRLRRVIGHICIVRLSTVGVTGIWWRGSPPCREIALLDVSAIVVARKGVRESVMLVPIIVDWKNWRSLLWTPVRVWAGIIETLMMRGR